MNEVLQTQLAEVIGLAKDGVILAVEAIQQQMPDLTYQLLAWGFWSSFIIWVIGLATSCIFIALVRLLIRHNIRAQKRLKEERKVYYNSVESNKNTIYGVIGTLALIFGIAGLSSLTWLKILIAPKLYLIEYITACIK